MKTTHLILPLLGAVLAAFLVLPRLASAQAAVTKVADFSNSPAGYEPVSGLVLASDGNFYGVTPAAGSSGIPGTIFRVSPTGGLTTIHTFSGSDGANPLGALIQATDGYLYGTTAGDSYYTGGFPTNNGTVFRIGLDGTFTTLFTFPYDSTTSTYPDGLSPQAALVQGSDGNLYGTTITQGPPTPDGVGSQGTIFEMTTDGTLLNVTALLGGTGPQQPQAPLVEYGAGVFYGTTYTGGSDFEEGSVYQYTVAGGATTLHGFDAQTDNAGLVAGVTLAPDGNFYGTCRGIVGYGSYWRISPGGDFTLLGLFNGTGNGSTPSGGLCLASDGNLYGTTSQGGSDTIGTIFQLTTAGVLTTVYTFTQDNTATLGYSPKETLVQGTDGRLYGTTSGGSANNGGAVFTVSLAGHPGFFTGEASLGNGVYYLDFANGNYFGYYSYLTDPAYIYHFDLGYEYVFDAQDGNLGVYFYDFASNDFFYTSPSFPFPYLYDFGLSSTVYYYPDPNNPGRYNTNGVRYFYVFNTGKIISK